MKQPATSELYTYWNRLRGNRAAPDRAEIEPAAIRSALADTFMLDVDAEQQFPLRLSGSRINALFCAEQKRRPFIDMWSEGEARNIAAILRTVADASCPVIAGAVTAPAGYPELEVEFLLLPLRHGGSSIARILGGLTTLRKPAWLGLLPAERLMLRSLRTIADSVAPLNPDRPRMKRWPAGNATGNGAFETRGHLRIYRGGM